MQLFNNTISDPIFEEFQLLYKEGVYKYCCIIKKFTINIYDTDGYLNLTNVPFIDEVENSPLSYYISNESKDATFTNAAIIYNEVFCNELKLSKYERFASIAHEIGHIAHFFSTHKDSDNAQSVEIYSDLLPKNLGLLKDLVSALNKLIDSGKFNATKEIMKMRIKFLII